MRRSALRSHLRGQEEITAAARSRQETMAGHSLTAIIGRRQWRQHRLLLLPSRAEFLDVKTSTS